MIKQLPGPDAQRVRPPLSPLVGREREVEEVLDLLARSPVVTLTGPPGVGKSRLAVQVVNHLHGRGGTVMLGLGGLTHGDQVAPVVTEALAGNHGRGSAGRGEDHAEGAVVLLDDCDRVLAACAEAVPALVGHGMRVLATSREPLRADGEVVWRVPPLSLPQPAHVEPPTVLANSDAVRLFCQRAVSAHRAFVPIGEHTPEIARICRRLDGIPLAIELAARNVAAYSTAQIAAGLDDPFSLLTDGVRTAHPRHHSMWACLAWSYDVLSAAEQMVFERLAVFPGAFSVDAALEVCAPDEMGPGEGSRIMRTLVDKSLIEPDNVANRACYRLLETVRRFAAEKLASVGDDDEARARHGRWCAGVVEAAGDARAGRAWLERLGPYHDDIHVALEWAVSSDRPDTAIVLGGADSRLCAAQGRYREARQRLERLFATAASASSPSLRARVLTDAGVSDVLVGEFAGAMAHLDDAAAVVEEAGEALEATRCQTLSFLEVLAGDAAALESLAAAVVRARELGEPALVVDALAALGRGHLLVGDAGAARADFAEALELARRHGDQMGEAQALVGLGGARVTLGDYGGAEASLAKGLELARDLGELHAAGVALAWLGEGGRLRGDVTFAQSWYQQALELARSLDHPYPLALALLGLGLVALDYGDSPTARARFAEALLTVRTRSLSQLLAPCLCGLARVAPDPATARSLVEEALASAKQCGDKVGEALALEQSARLDGAAGDLRAATARHQQALRLWAQVGDPAAIASSLEALGRLAAAEERFSVAARLFGAAESLRGRHGCARPVRHVEKHSSYVESVRRASGKESFDHEWRQGRELSTQAAISYAIEHRGTRVQRPSRGWEALTTAERRVADLVAQGCTNAEVAEKLSIAPTTVKAHLRRVYAKVGTLNRTSLAAELHRLTGR